VKVPLTLINGNATDCGRNSSAGCTADGFITFPAVTRDLACEMSRSSVGRTQPPVQSLTGLKQAKRKADHSPPVSRLRMSGAIPLPPTFLHSMPMDDCTHYLGGSNWPRSFLHTLEIKLAVQIGWSRAGPGPASGRETSAV